MISNLRLKFERYLHSVLPPNFTCYLRSLRHWPFFNFRVNRWATKILGPQYRRSVNCIEIDITYACNLSCNNCNRSIQQAPTGEYMSVEQIMSFIEESKAKGIRWRRIRLLGGEPTLHKNFFEILELLRQYRRSFSPGTRIEVSTNGYGVKVAQILSKIPDDINVINSAKSGNSQPTFAPFNIAPKDIPEHKHSDFRNSCWIAQNCGIGLGPSGYYPCPVAGAMDRVFGWNIGRQALPDASDTMEDLLQRCCQHCGHFDRRYHPPLLNNEQSKSWKEAYARYREAPPKLTKYGETSCERASTATGTRGGLDKVVGLE